VHDRDRIGYTTADGMTRRYCCTKELVAKTKCFPGRLIVQVPPQSPRPLFSPLLAPLRPGGL
jgi:hypothetical protein